ncbi:MAG: aldose epimerase family protein [Mesorhizobium sp.]|nr:aldose epimerase family protein [Mesorhizobium sp.]
MTGTLFGTTAEGEPVHRHEIRGGGLTARIMEWGAAIQDLRLDGHDAPLVLGFDNFDDYPASSPYFGAIAGRYANRIAGGRFTIDGHRYQADTNFLGKHTLHGGAKSTGKRVWTLGEAGADFVTLTLHDPDGFMGFPGNLEITCTYRLKLPGTLSIELSATSDQPTLCNLTNHSYFNLDSGGADSILDHRLMLAAGAYLPVDDELIPTGVVQPVEGTAFDFLLARPIRLRQDGEQIVYDHNFCLGAQRGPLKQAAWAQGASSGVEMEMWTTEPGVQFYAGHKVARDAPGLGGRKYGAHAGFCLEAQAWPDSPNRSYFPQAVLWPGDRYRHVTEYRFRHG